MPDGEALLAEYRAVRARTEALAAPLTPEDQQVQSMPDASPTKWHLAHTSWFFETFVLAPHAGGYRPFHPRYGYLFNSYYESVGERHERPRRGLLSRPALEEVLGYRRHVDAAMEPLLARGGLASDVATIVALGLNHEQQHQELILTDAKHLLGTNPLRPPYHAERGPGGVAGELRWFSYDEAIVEIGHAGAGFAFDNEGPSHRALVPPFALASRPVTCGEFLAFVRDRGYQRPELWLSDGWAEVRAHGWRAPLYWEEREGSFWLYTLGGPRPLDPDEPVCHVGFYEADAYARWAGARLPTEIEWERAARAAPLAGHFAEGGRLHPAAAPEPAGSHPAQLFGDVWEWTASAYAPYPGYRPAAGALGEYNGKFMCNQLVLRGGSCFTPRSHVRATYRNFFPPGARWQMSGIRLARDEGAR